MAPPGKSAAEVWYATPDAYWEKLARDRIRYNEEKKRIGLSLRQLQDDPWKSRIEEFQVGQLIEGKITRLTKFGAFARIGDDIEGLIHVSEISDQRVEHPKEELKEGDVVNLRIIRIEADRRRIGLSMRKVDSAAYVDKDMKALAETGHPAIHPPGTAIESGEFFLRIQKPYSGETLADKIENRDNDGSG